MKTIGCMFGVLLAIGCGSTRLDVGDKPPSASAPDGGAPPHDVTNPPPEPVWQWLNPQPTARDLLGIWGAAGHIWGVGKAGTVVHYDGSRWENAYQGALDEVFYGVWTSGPSDVWVIGKRDAGSRVLHWDGADWESNFTLGQHPVAAIWGTDANNVWAAGGQFVFHWDGHNWEQTWDWFAAPDRGFRTIWGANATDVWVAGYQTLAHWDGAAWNPAWPVGGDAGPREYLAMWGASSDDIWAVYELVDQLGTISFVHYDGKTWTEVSDDQLEIHPSCEPNEIEHGARMAGTSSTEIVVALGGIPGTRCTMSWDGKAWTSLQENAPVRNALCTDSAGTVWDVGIFGQVDRLESISIDAYGTRRSKWKDATRGTRGNLYSVSSPKAGVVWALSSGFQTPTSGDSDLPDAIYWSDTEQGWKSSGLDTTSLIHSLPNRLVALDENNVWAVGRDYVDDNPSARILHWKGEGWSLDTALEEGTELLNLWAEGPSTLWAVGYQGKSGLVMRFDGEHWKRFDPLGTDLAIVSVSGTNDHDVWLLGCPRTSSSCEKTATVFHFDGLAFTEHFQYALPQPVDIYSLGLFDWTPDGFTPPPEVWAAGPHSVWVSGQPGWHWDGSAWKPAASGDFYNYGFWGTSPDDVWMLSAASFTYGSQSHSAVRRFDGSTTSVELEHGLDVWSMSGASSSDVWVVGKGGATLRFAPPGRSKDDRRPR